MPADLSKVDPMDSDTVENIIRDLDPSNSDEQRREALENFAGREEASLLTAKVLIDTVANDDSSNLRAMAQEILECDRYTAILESDPFLKGAFEKAVKSMQRDASAPRAGIYRPSFLKPVFAIYCAILVCAGWRFSLAYGQVEMGSCYRIGALLFFLLIPSELAGIHLLQRNGYLPSANNPFLGVLAAIFDFEFLGQILTLVTVLPLIILFSPIGPLLFGLGVFLKPRESG